MALNSPGVLVTVKDESSYPASGPGTIPLIFLATAQDKIAPGSLSAIAQGTTKALAGKPFLLTSQSDALNFFGTPIFQESNGTILQGDELNEWGVHCLYSALGVTNQIWAVRADIDLHELEPTQVEPRNFAVNSTAWIDLAESVWGLRKFNSKTHRWDLMEVLVPSVDELDATDKDQPSSSFGVVIGETIYCVVPYIKGKSESTDTEHSTNTIWQKTVKNNAWTKAVIQYKSKNAPVGEKDTLWVKIDSASNGLNLSLKTFKGSTSSWANTKCLSGADLVELEAAYNSLLMVTSTGITFSDRIDGAIKSGNLIHLGSKKPTDMAVNVNTFKQTVEGGDPVSTNIVIRFASTTLAVVETKKVELKNVDTYATDLVEYINTTLGVYGFSAVINETTPTNVVIRSAYGITFTLSHDDDSEPSVVKTLEATSNWGPLNYFADTDEITTVAEEKTLWFTDELIFDFMVTSSFSEPENTELWKGLGKTTVGNDWMVSQTAPNTRAENNPLREGDIWVDPQDGANFEFYVYRNGDWFLLDATDQSTSDGILFANMRQADEHGVGYITTPNNATVKAALLGSNQLDPDAPDGRMYPEGMIVCNLRSSGNIVRNFIRTPFEDYEITDFKYFVGDNEFTLAPAVNGDVENEGWRWMTASSLKLNGAGNFGRLAQRSMIVKALAESTFSEELRSEFMDFNLMLAPGYVELLDELVTLNTDRRETSYIISDVPARLNPTGTAINNWAKNANNAPSNGEDGRLTSTAYGAMYMGWCLGTNVDGAEVAIPGSSVALRTYLYSDSVSYVWYPPAGTQRGIVTNATSSGYINAEGEFEPVIYNVGQRDVAFLNNINPITLRPGRGLVVFGDKSLSPTASALDRVNVGRLVVQIRTDVERLCERFLFELNTAALREEIAGTINAYLANIYQLNGLADYAVIADTSNNTPDRIARNELWVDLAILPTKSVNFIFVPIRITNDI